MDGPRLYARGNRAVVPVGVLEAGRLRPLLREGEMVPGVIGRVFLPVLFQVKSSRLFGGGGAITKSRHRQNQPKFAGWHF